MANHRSRADSGEINKATDELHRLLETQTQLADEKRRLADEQAESNRLDRIIIEQKQKELELNRHKIALENEAEKRRSANLNQLLDRLTADNERIKDYVSKLVTTDDNFGETVQRVIDTQREHRDTLLDCLRAQHALLSRNQEDINQSRALMQSRILLLQERDNLDKLELDASLHGAGNVPLRLYNQIEATKVRIEELEAKIQQQRAG